MISFAVKLCIVHHLYYYIIFYVSNFLNKRAINYWYNLKEKSFDFKCYEIISTAGLYKMGITNLFSNYMV